ncbi:hypothetical protein VFPFJ_02531 [Purpureocillium lilacinum]|uniref:Uncharacterized protein n=1 Tax=Purpureocillium lilacinum TaxID=33203 RepID=A0A179GLX2_PURLI|nr:hypothetical protein VFPFJ_02531 [Purpureocillium lilacinum]OAQ78887.1 hypothetical protein VFPBJ_07008 [Purpureocillium lilacinum]OAQ93369.1 hypothetical protein VFPFJ_02531 [Purpureocillium lilacinum]
MLCARLFGLRCAAAAGRRGGGHGLRAQEERRGTPGGGREGRSSGRRTHENLRVVGSRHEMVVLEEVDGGTECVTGEGALFRWL